MIMLIGLGAPILVAIATVWIGWALIERFPSRPEIGLVVSLLVCFGGTALATSFIFSWYNL